MSNVNWTQVIIGAAILGGGIISGNPYIAFAGFTMMAGGLMQKEALNEANRAFLLNRVGSDTGLPIVYGTARLAPVLVDVRVKGTHLYVVAAFSHGSGDGTGISGFETIFLDDNIAIAGTKRGVGTGTPRIKGGSQLGASLLTDGWTPNVANSVRSGDVVRIDGQERAFLVLADAGSDGSGNLTVTIDPPLTLAPADNALVTLQATGAIQPPYIGNFGDKFVDRVQEPSFLEAFTHLGTSTQGVDATMTAKFPATWPSTATGKGIAYIVFHLTWNQQCYGGLPNINAVAKGVKVYDPRDTTWKWATNPALCVRDYLTSPIYGLGVAAGEVDEASFIAAANFCDDAIAKPGGGTQARFTCNGVIDTGRAITSNLTSLLTACRGQLVYQGGKFRLFIPQATTASGFALTRDNLVGDLKITTPGQREAPNILRTQFIDPLQGWETDTIQWPPIGAANPYLTEDADFRSEVEIDLPFTTDRLTVEQIAMVTLKEARKSTRVEATAKESALQCAVGDVITLTHDTPGWTAKPFWVQGLVLNEDMTVAVSMREYDAACYSYDSQTTPPSPPGTDLPDPLVQYPPTDFTLLSDGTTLLQLADGTIIPRIKVSWLHPEITGFLLYFEVQARVEGTTTWTYSSNVDPWEAPPDVALYIANVTEGDTWEVRVRAVGVIQSSPWLTQTVAVVGKGAAPSNVTGFTGSFADGLLKVSWNAIADIDLAEYEVREGGTGWADATLFYKGRVTQFSVPPNGITKRSYTFRLKAKDASGNYSVTAATLSLSDTAPDADAIVPASDIEVYGVNRQFLIVVDASGSNATEFRLYASLSDSFTPSDTTRRVIEIIPGPGPHESFVWTPPDLTWCDVAVYFRLGLKDVLTDVLSEAEDYTAQFSGSTSAALPPEITQDDGVTVRVLSKGHLTGTAPHGAAVSFPINFQHIPLVLIRGGAVAEPRSRWGPTGSGAEGGLSPMREWRAVETYGNTGSGTETEIASRTIPGGTLFGLGSVVRIRAYGHVTGGSLAGCAIRLEQGGTNVYLCQLAAYSNNCNFVLEAEIVYTTENEQRLFGRGYEPTTNVWRDATPASDVTTFDDTSDIKVAFRAKTGAGTIVLDMAEVYSVHDANWLPPIYDDVAALDVSGSGFTMRARLRQKAAMTERNDQFPNGNLLDAVGETAVAPIDSAPAADDRYWVAYTVTVTPVWYSATVTVAIDSSADGGSVWVERATRTYATSVGRTWDFEAVAIIVSGLDSTDQVRLRIKSFSGIGSFSVHGFYFPVDGFNGMTYLTTPGDQFASKTPEAGDVVFWEAIETT